MLVIINNLGLEILTTWRNRYKHRMNVTKGRQKVNAIP